MEPEPTDATVTLTPDEWELVKELVFAGQELDESERSRWLDEHCDSARVRAEAERLLKAPTGFPNFLGVSAPERLGLRDVRAEHPERVGHFKIVRQIGAGGMGVVYAAIDERLGRQVAVKVLHPDAMGQNEQRRRLLWDARAASALNHPNIVCVYEAGEEDGVEYVAMELVTGQTLDDLLTKGRPPQRLLLEYAVQIASALETAHAADIVHRDVKPRNVMISDAGAAKLVDFGLAKNPAARLTDQSAPATIEGHLAGTVAYMSPEQAEGAEVDFRSDVFSFGSVLYEMLTFQKAFSGVSSVSVLAKIIHAQPTPVSAIRADIDPRLADIVNRCLRKDRQRRFQSMADVRILLEEALHETTAKRTVTKRLWKAVPMAAAAIAGAVLAGVALKYWLRAPEPAPAVAALERLTWDGGLTTAPAISPDGTVLAYASDRAGRGDLDVWVQRMGGSDPIRLTNNPADESRPTFSPDGVLVAYRSERDGGGVYVVPSFGGTERLLVPGGRDPKYSPDGKWIACWTGDVGGGFRPGTSRIVIAAASGGETRTFRPDFETTAYPLWTPDGTSLLFLGRKRTGASGDASVIDWWIAPEGTGGERATGAVRALRAHGLAPPEGQFWFRPESWLAGGREVLFTARQKDATNVWAIDLGTGGQVGAQPRPMTRGAAVHALPASPSGRSDASFVFASVAVDVQLWQVPLRADGRTDEPRRLLPTVSQVGSPSISRDGRTIIFSARQAKGYRLVSVDTGTGDQATVATVEAADFVRTVLSGDGRSIVYSANRHSYRIGLRGDVPEQICASCGWPTHLSADGTEALFESAGSEERLLLWSRAGLRPLISGDAGKDHLQFGGRFSPDGRWVTFCAGPPGSNDRQIVVVPKAPERVLRQDEWIAITDGTTADREPYFSPDGRRLYFLSDRDGFRCIWARPVDPATARPTGPAYPVAHFHHARALLRGWAPAVGSIGLSASVDSLVFTVAATSGNIWWQPER